MKFKKIFKKFFYPTLKDIMLNFQVEVFKPEKFLSHIKKI
jgi:hypothetical protein